MKHVLAFAMLLAALPVSAQGYIGGGVGSSSVSISDCGINGFSCSTNDTSTGFKIFAGREFSKSFSFEGGYVNFGKFSQSASGFINGTRVDAKGVLDGDGFFADFLFTAPITQRLGVFGRLGLVTWKANVKVEAHGGGRSASGSDSASGFSPDYGVGVKFAASEKVELRGEFQRFVKIGDDATTGRSDVDLVSASLVYRF